MVAYQKWQLSGMLLLKLFSGFPICLYCNILHCTHHNSKLAASSQLFNIAAFWEAVQAMWKQCENNVKAMWKQCAMQRALYYILLVDGGGFLEQLIRSRPGHSLAHYAPHAHPRHHHVHPRHHHAHPRHHHAHHRDPRHHYHEVGDHLNRQEVNSNIKHNINDKCSFMNKYFKEQWVLSCAGASWCGIENLNETNQGSVPVQATNNQTN